MTKLFRQELIDNLLIAVRKKIRTWNKLRECLDEFADVECSENVQADDTAMLELADHLTILDDWSKAPRLSLDRQALSQIVRKAWVDYCIATGQTKSSWLVPWERLDTWQQAVDGYIGVVVAEKAIVDLVSRLSKACGNPALEFSDFSDGVSFEESVIRFAEWRLENHVQVLNENMTLHVMIRQLLAAKGCLTNGQPEIYEEISAQFDINLEDAKRMAEFLKTTGGQ